MPLIKGKSEKSFKKNVEAEMHAGKPQKQSLAIAYAMKRKAKKMAQGGMVDEQAEPMSDEFSKSHPMKHDAAAMHEDDRMMGQHGAMEEGAQGSMDDDEMQHEHMISHSEENQDAHEDMVGRIMKQRQQHFSKGGMVANKDQGVSSMDLDAMADGRQNEMDDLALRDDLEFSYTGANSGDELSDAQEDADRSDIVARIMRSRAKKDKLPNPR